MRKRNIKWGIVFALLGFVGCNKLSPEKKLENCAAITQEGDCNKACEWKAAEAPEEPVLGAEGDDQQEPEQDAGEDESPNEQPKGTCERQEDAQGCSAKTVQECEKDPICGLDTRLEPILPVQEEPAQENEDPDNETADLDGDSSLVEPEQQVDAFCYYKDSGILTQKEQEVREHKTKLLEESKKLQKRSAQLKKLRTENEHLHNTCVLNMSPEAYVSGLIRDGNGKLLTDAKRQQSLCEAKIAGKQLSKYIKTTKGACEINKDVTQGKTDSDLCVLLGVKNNGTAANDQTSCGGTYMSQPDGRNGWINICIWQG